MHKVGLGVPGLVPPCSGSMKGTLALNLIVTPCLLIYHGRGEIIKKS